MSHFFETTKGWIHAVLCCNEWMRIIGGRNDIILLQMLFKSCTIIMNIHCVDGGDQV